MVQAVAQVIQMGGYARTKWPGEGEGWGDMLVRSCRQGEEQSAVALASAPRRQQSVAAGTSPYSTFVAQKPYSPKGPKGGGTAVYSTVNVPPMWSGCPST